VSSSLAWVTYKTRPCVKKEKKKPENRKQKKERERESLREKTVRGERERALDQMKTGHASY
jgi:hypothetical protein